MLTSLAHRHCFCFSLQLRFLHLYMYLLNYIHQNHFFLVNRPAGIMFSLIKLCCCIRSHVHKVSPIIAGCCNRLDDNDTVIKYSIYLKYLSIYFCWFTGRGFEANLSMSYSGKIFSGISFLAIIQDNRN